MKIEYGRGKTEFGPGVEIKLSGDEVANAIHAWLVAHQVYINGPMTIRVNNELCELGKVYVDPSGFVVSKGIKFSGRGSNNEKPRN